VKKLVVLFLSVFAIYTQSNAAFAPCACSATLPQQRTPEEQANLNLLLLRAARENKPEEVQRFLAAGANVNAFYPSGDTTLHIAAKHGFDAIALILLQNGAELLVYNVYGKTPLHLAVIHQHPNVVQLILECNNIRNQYDPAKYFAIINAQESTNGHRGVPTIGMTSLHYAMTFEDRTIAKLLVQFKANIQLQTLHKQTPRDFANMFTQQPETVVTVERKRSNPDHEESDTDQKERERERKRKK